MYVDFFILVGILVNQTTAFPITELKHPDPVAWHIARSRVHPSHRECKLYNWPLPRNVPEQALGGIPLKDR